MTATHPLLRALGQPRNGLGNTYLDALDEATAICDNRPGPERCCRVEFCGRELVDGACPEHGREHVDQGQIWNALIGRKQ